MLTLKDGAECAICGKAKFLVIDHSHQDGSLRGILCSDCNTSIGKLGDTVVGLERALSYLKNPPGVDI